MPWAYYMSKNKECEMPTIVFIILSRYKKDNVNLLINLI